MSHFNKLCIDPGHGMGNRTPSKYDPGACANGHEEANVALQYALAIKYVFAREGIGVFLTRDDANDYDPVGTRDNRAKAEGCTHFLSLHLNAGGGTGTETFYRGDEDHGWAEKVQKLALEVFGLKDRGLKTEDESQHTRLAVLDFDGPGCLLELGFIDSARDMSVIGQRDARLRFAEGLLRIWREI